MGQKKAAGEGRSTPDRKKSASRPKSATSTKSASTARQSKTPKARARASQRPQIARRTSTAQRLRQWGATFYGALKNPETWRTARQKLPPWTDEVGAILLIVLGAVMLTALLNTTSEARASVMLSDGLRQLFGSMAYVAALGVLAAGIIILLPKFGIVVRIGWTRAIAIELAFGAACALLHLTADDPQPRILAWEGGGGGFVGWGLTEITSVLGRFPSIALHAMVLGATAVYISGLRVRHLIAGVNWMAGTLHQGLVRVEALEIEPPPPAHPRPDASGGSPQASAPDLPDRDLPRAPYSRPSIVPRAPRAEDPPETPHAPRNKPAPPPEPEPGAKASAVEDNDPPADKPPKPPAKPLTKAQKRAIADQTRRRLGASNGRSLIAPGDPGDRPSIVPRDLLPGAGSPAASARAGSLPRNGETIDRVFTVEDFAETKKVGKRDPILPPLELLSDVELNKPTEEEINTNARIIKNTLLEFDVETEVIDVKVGPTVTQYAVSPYTESVNGDGERVLNRVRVSQIANLSGDLALALSARRLRIQAPVPGHSYVGVEVPNRHPSTVALRPVLESERFYNYRERPLVLPLGRDVSGDPFITDLSMMPHLLIAGTTGSGKSIMLAAMTTSLVVNNPPDRVKLVLLDPKMVELSRFNGLPHLLGPVETELDRIIGVLRWATREMDFRYKLLEKEAARNIETYNRALGRRRKDERLPYIAIIIDEIGDLMMQRPDETERALTRLAQMARAVGIHLMVATQRPSVDVITGLIKANFPARISFAVASGIDSRVILDHTGAETLMGRGDMLFLAPDAAGPQRIQGCYISDEEVNAVVTYWKEWYAAEVEAERIEPLGIAPWERGMTRREVLAETDPMLEEAISLVVAEREASASLIQRRLGLGYPRAARLIDLMHELGVVGPARAGGRTREVLVKPGSDPFKKLIDKRLQNKQ